MNKSIRSSYLLRWILSRIRSVAATRSPSRTSEGVLGQEETQARRRENHSEFTIVLAVSGDWWYVLHVFLKLCLCVLKCYKHEMLYTLSVIRTEAQTERTEPEPQGSALADFYSKAAAASVQCGVCGWSPRRFCRERPLNASLLPPWHPCHLATASSWIRLRCMNNGCKFKG